MKKLILLGMLLFLQASTYAQIINFPDLNFKNALLSKNPSIDTNNDGEITQQEAIPVTSIESKQNNILS